MNESVLHPEINSRKYSLRCLKLYILVSITFGSHIPKENLVIIRDIRVRYSMNRDCLQTVFITSSLAR